MKNINIYIVILVLLFGGLIYIDMTKKEPINWTPTYNVQDKIPYGMYIFNEEIEEILQNKNIEKINSTVYEHFMPLYDYDSLVNNYKVKGTILSISGNYTIDNESTDELFYFVGHGNNVFLSCEDFSEKLKDSLHFETHSAFEITTEIKLNLANKNLDTTYYKFNNNNGATYFSKIDTLNSVVLGYQNYKNKKNINFIKVPYKNGCFYLHTQPICFTNFNLLKDDLHKYTEKVISYIPKGKIFWLLKNQNGKINDQTMLRYIINQKSLSIAWYLFLIGMIVFIIFNAKRKQRIVPIIKPLTNTTVDFTKTIGNLYYMEGNHQNIIDKKIIYFLERIRNEFLIDTSVLDENFIKKLHLKTGKNITDIETIVRLINFQRKNYHQSVEEDLLEINLAIEKIFN